MFFRRLARRKLRKQAEEEIARIGRDAALARVDAELEANYQIFNEWPQGTGISYTAWGYETVRLTRKQTDLQMYREILISWPRSIHRP